MIKPILFNTDMVRAILEGRKTVTRRAVKPQPRGHAALLTSNLLPETTEAGVGAVYAFEDGTVTSPPYRPGDILYVRETWAPFYETMYSAPVIGYRYYSETDEEIKERLPEYLNWFWPGRWSPSVHMPREAARIFLRVKNVRVDRLNKITPKDIRDEGVEFDMEHPVGSYKRFIDLWNSTIKPADRAIYSWDANPWCWVIAFERCEKPEEV